MTASPASDTILRVSALRQGRQNAFLLEPDAAARAALARRLGAETVRKLRFEGHLTPKGRNSWMLQATLGATAVQACIVTLEPVTTRIDTQVNRSFVPQAQIDLPEGEAEIEMPEDDTIEPLGEIIDLAGIMEEALALALPDYPRKDGVTVQQTGFAPDGVTPMTDGDVKPFAGLAAMREKMRDKGGED